MTWRDSEGLMGARGALRIIALCCLLFSSTISGTSQSGEIPCDKTLMNAALSISSEAANPLRAIVSKEILTWEDWLKDGGFEQGQDELVLLNHPVARLGAAAVLRTRNAAHEGSWGIRATAGGDQGILLAVRAEIEKGEQTRCRFWVRSRRGDIELSVSVLGVERGQGVLPVPLFEPQPFAVSENWTEVCFTFANTRGVAYALLAIDVGPNTILDLDDVAIEGERWTEAPATHCTRTVGGITVPSVAVVPVHFNVLIHIEDPRMITQNEDYFREKTAVFTELARVLHEHGGFLTIQPEEDWPLASMRFAPETLPTLVREYGVAVSYTHLTLPTN